MGIVTEIQINSWVYLTVEIYFNIYPLSFLILINNIPISRFTHIFDNNMSLVLISFVSLDILLTLHFNFFISKRELIMIPSTRKSTWFLSCVFNLIFLSKKMFCNFSKKKKFCLLYLFPTKHSVRKIVAKWIESEVFVYAWARAITRTKITIGITSIIVNS